MNYFRDSNGNESLTATLSIIAFTIVMVKVLIGGASIAAGEFSYSFGTIDSLSIAAILGPCLGAYAVRRHTDANQPVGEGDETREDGKGEES